MLKMLNLIVNFLHYVCIFPTAVRKMKRILIYIIFSAFLQPTIRGTSYDPVFYTDSIFDKRIKTVQLYREEWNLSYPLIRLNSSDRLAFHFDLLDDHPDAYYYTFIHCNKDWQRSDLFSNDYLEGFSYEEIRDYRPSFNTTVPYFHYSLIFPEERLKPLLSGNYILYVYHFDNPDVPVITRRFMVTEDTAGIDISVHRPQIPDSNNEKQQVDFSVNIAGLGIIDPFRNIYSSILQNGRWDNAKMNLKPDVYGSNELKYTSLSDKNIFMGGNEYRYFDIKSIKRPGVNIERIDFRAPDYHVLLLPSDNREFKPYFYRQDINGKYIIAVQEGRDPDTDADYLYVYFTLPLHEKPDAGELYVSGLLADRTYGEENRMLYNPGRKQYECTMLLKQGWYDYEYVFINRDVRDGVSSRFEGSHSETENDYHILVYYRNPRERHDRLLATGSINTLNRMTY